LVTALTWWGKRKKGNERKEAKTFAISSGKQKKQYNII